MTSLLFLCGILPVFLLLYQIPKTVQGKNRLLFALSLLFYAWMTWQGVLVLLMVILWSWAAGQAEQSRHGILLNAGFLAALLFFFRILLRWHPIPGLAVPLGISFYVFSAISYVADVYMGKAEPEKSLSALGVYLSFFGRIWQGPIGRWQNMSGQLHGRSVTWKDRQEGSLQIIRGLAKKVLLADALHAFCAGLSGQTTFIGSWLLAIGWSFQLYFDFSGYSDMAIGISRLFGFHVPPNFMHPYRAQSIKAFWNRWHVSLAVFLRDYIYIPLGGNRRHPVLNAAAVWAITILWHGAAMPCILWGLYAGGVAILAGWGSVRAPARVKQLLVFLYALVGWVFFFSPTMAAGLAHVGRLAGIGCSRFLDGTAWLLGRDYLLTLAACVLFSGSLWERLEKRIGRMRQGMLLLDAIYGLLLLSSVAGIVSGSMLPFLYSQF